MSPPLFIPPPGLTYSVLRTPRWKTFHQEAISGKDSPLAAWSYPRWQWSLTFDYLFSDATLQQQYVATFYNQMSGSVGTFQYADPDDYSATLQTFAIGDGTTTAFQVLGNKTE